MLDAWNNGENTPDANKNMTSTPDVNTNMTSTPDANQKGPNTLDAKPIPPPNWLVHLYNNSQYFVDMSTYENCKLIHVFISCQKNNPKMIKTDKIAKYFLTLQRKCYIK